MADVKVSRGGVGVVRVGVVMVAGWCLWLGCLPALGQLVSFNDYAPGGGTHPNATTYGPAGTSGSQGPLKDIVTGAGTTANVLVYGSGFSYGPLQGSPGYGTPAFIVFDGYVDFVGDPNPALELSASASVTYFFSGLDASGEYNLQGTAIRGEGSYRDRWSLFQLAGTRGFTSRHSAGTLTMSNVASLGASQVAINTGDNSQGEVAWWEHIRPSIDGTFSVVSTKYSGPVPGGSSAGTIGYGMTGLRLEKGGVYTGRTNVPPRQPVPNPPNINGIRTVFMVLMENHDWRTINGNADCPYINNTLLPMSSYATRYFTPPGLHPSEPNYIWLIAGDNFGIRNDSGPSVNHISSTENLFTQLDSAGISWKTYQENMPGTSGSPGTNCPTTSSYPYAVRHNPFVFFDSVLGDGSYCASHVRPYSELAGDLSSPGTSGSPGSEVARFNFITPNVTNDMHDFGAGSPSRERQGDSWLAREVPQILASAAYTNGGLLLITWDEGSNDGDGPIGMIALSPRAKGNGYHNSIYYTHSSTLRTLQDIFGVRPYLGDAANAESLRDLFNAPQIITVRWENNGLELTATNLLVGTTNVLEASIEVSPANWTPIQTSLSTNVVMTFRDPAPVPVRQFYRVVELQ